MKESSVLVRNVTTYLFRDTEENSEMNIDHHTSSSSYHTMVTDHAGPRFNVDQNEEQPNREAQRLYDMLNAADRELWPGSKKHSQLSLTLRLEQAFQEDELSTRTMNTDDNIEYDMTPVHPEGGLIEMLEVEDEEEDVVFSEDDNFIDDYEDDE
ncbi:hypothetical protein OROHE_026895 [Orobanche hederae]